MGLRDFSLFSYFEVSFSDFEATFSDFAFFSVSASGSICTSSYKGLGGGASEAGMISMPFIWTIDWFVFGD